MSIYVQHISSETKLSIHFPWFQHPNRLGQRWQQWLHCFGWTLPPCHCGTHAAQAAAAEVSSTTRQGFHHCLLRWDRGCSWKNSERNQPQGHRNIDGLKMVPTKDLPGCAWLVRVASEKRHNSPATDGSVCLRQLGLKLTPKVRHGIHRWTQTSKDKSYWHCNGTSLGSRNV